MQKIVINKCYGGFGLSDEGKERYLELGGKDKTWDMARNDINLVRVVEEMGKKVNGRFAKLQIIIIPDDVDWDIQEYDGMEWIAEIHRTWN